MKQLNKSFNAPEKRKAFLLPEQKIIELEKTRQGVIQFTDQLDEKLSQGNITGIEHKLILSEKLGGKRKEEILNYIDQQIAKEHKKLNNTRTNKRKKVAIAMSIAVILIIIGAMAGLIAQDPTTITGLATGSIREHQETINYNEVFTHYTELAINETNLTSLKISGILKGTKATIKLKHNNVIYTVAEITNKQSNDLITGLVIEEKSTGETQTNHTITTNKEEYLIGETVTITISPEEENISYYVYKGEENQKLDNNEYAAKEAGEHKAIALITLNNNIIRLKKTFTVLNKTINETETNETNKPIEVPKLNKTKIEINETNTTIPSIKTNNTNNTNITNKTIEEKTFENICLETCTLEQGDNPILIIELEEGSTLEITELTITSNKVNQAPKQVKDLPDLTITTSQIASLDLEEYFTDPEKDQIFFDVGESELNLNLVINNLKINNKEPGNFKAYVYATDGDQLITSNIFEVTVIPSTEEQKENNTINITQPEDNETNATTTIIPSIGINATNKTNTTEAIKTDCDEPNLNKRPSYCFVGIEDKVYQDLSANIENKNQAIVGRFTRFGNLVIKGLLIENSTGTSDKDDFRIGYTNLIDFEEFKTTTAWIDSSTGNLHLKGKLTQEIETLEPPQKNTYIITNKFGIILAYFNEKTGDLFLKGNIVQLGNI